MLGAVIGDIIGSTYEWHNVKTKDFDLFPEKSRFTDDTILSVAVADALLHREVSDIPMHKAYAMWYRQYYHRYPDAGFGQMFSEWARADVIRVQRSFGNGAAMRAAPIGYAASSIREVKKEVYASCRYTHRNREAIKGAQAVAVCVYLAKTGVEKKEIRNYMEKHYYPGLTSLDALRAGYVFDSRASYSVPPALLAFFESDSYEDAVRNAVSIGGDSDTIACMAGGIAQAYYHEIPMEIKDRAFALLDTGLRTVIRQFTEKYLPLG
ncbi:MAG: ADP-ribosylglycohydrolase family protein [Lachnospiraceae bacterium]|nr:ADP-ribosylglycohydrolase family protein [Lachnospiraceae bacterium]